MPTPFTTTGKPLGTCRNVEIFATGTYRDRDYTEADLDEVVTNFYRLGPLGMKLLHPPNVLGHEETQEYLQKTNLPAAGWVANLRRVGDKLIADFVDVPEAIANLINQRQYKKVSAEIYDDFTDDFGKSYGKALRRVALLGGEIPQVKRLADIPTVTFSERSRTRIRPADSRPSAHGTVLCFSEVISLMDRNALIEKLKAAMPGMDDAVIETLTDEQLQAIVDNAPGATAAADAAGVPPMAEGDNRADMISELVAMGQDPMALEGMDDVQLQGLLEQIKGADASMTQMADGSMTREEMIAKLVEQGQDPATLEAMSDEELKAILDGSSGTTAPESAVPMSDANKLKKYSEKVMSDLRKIDAQNRIAIVKRKKANIEIFCENLVRNGKITPNQKGDYVTLLMLLNDRNAVHKFTENGKTTRLTSLQSKQRELLSRPAVIHFGEKFKTAGEARTEKTIAIQKAEMFAQKHRVSFEKAGRSVKDFVQTFSETYAKNPAEALQMIGDEYR